MSAISQRNSVPDPPFVIFFLEMVNWCLVLYINFWGCQNFGSTLSSVVFLMELAFLQHLNILMEFSAPKHSPVSGISPENSWLEDQTSFYNGILIGDMLYNFGRGM